MMAMTTSVEIIAVITVLPWIPGSFEIGFSIFSPP
jgi:hypothetical protein